jgi:GNAT superfamily N-acetyltransferase
VSAVVAVVPYPPGRAPTLPEPDDALGRPLAFFTSLPVRRAVGVGDVPGGVAVLDPDFPHSRDNSRLVLTEPVDAATIDESAAEVAGNAGWPHRELLLMARPAAPLAGGDGAAVVGQREVHDLWDRSWRTGLAHLGPHLDRVVAQLVDREHLNDRVVAVTDVVAREDGRVVAAGQLRMDGATAAVDSVLTDPAVQGRGHAGAVLARSLDVAAAAGCDLVVLEAAADDWPRHWYARRGFETVGSIWNADRPA